LLCCELRNYLLSVKDNSLAKRECDFTTKFAIGQNLCWQKLYFYRLIFCADFKQKNYKYLIMKVTFKITKDSYLKIVKLNDGTKLVEKWVRSGNVFSQTDDSVQFNDSDFLQETKEALDINFMELCDAIENESATVFDEDEIPTTDDGHILKRGDSFYTMGAMFNKELKKWSYLPLRLKFPLDWGSQGSDCFYSIEKCRELCDKRSASE
jgi:hypothetical protein